MITLILGKRGYTKKGVPIFYVLKVVTENITDKELFRLFINNGYIKRTWREPYPKLRSKLEDVFNYNINKLGITTDYKFIELFGFTFRVRVIEMVDC